MTFTRNFLHHSLYFILHCFFQSLLLLWGVEMPPFSRWTHKPYTNFACNKGGQTPSLDLDNAVKFESCLNWCHAGIDCGLQSIAEVLLAVFWTLGCLLELMHVRFGGGSQLQPSEPDLTFCREAWAFGNRELRIAVSATVHCHANKQKVEILCARERTIPTSQSPFRIWAVMPIISFRSIPQPKAIFIPAFPIDGNFCSWILGLVDVCVYLFQTSFFG